MSGIIVTGASKDSVICHLPKSNNCKARNDTARKAAWWLCAGGSSRPWKRSQTSGFLSALFGGWLNPAVAQDWLLQSVLDFHVAASLTSLVTLLLSVHVRRFGFGVGVACMLTSIPIPRPCLPRKHSFTIEGTRVRSPGCCHSIESEASASLGRPPYPIRA